MKHYQILADEGWTHHETPPNRYHHFFVALLAPADVMSKLEQVLKNSTQKFIFNNHKDFNVNIKFIDSKTSLIHQVIDILMGAAVYYGNFKCCKNKEPKIQDICKLKFAKYIQKKLKKIQKQDRNTKVFHWFESTGYVRSDLDKRHKFKIVIWKFIPNEHRIDSTWQHSKNKDIQKLKNKAKYLISKNFDECDVFKDKL